MPSPSPATEPGNEASPAPRSTVTPEPGMRVVRDVLESNDSHSVTGRPEVADQRELRARLPGRGTLYEHRAVRMRVLSLANLRTGSLDAVPPCFRDAAGTVPDDCRAVAGSRRSARPASRIGTSESSPRRRQWRAVGTRALRWLRSSGRLSKASVGSTPWRPIAGRTCAARSTVLGRPRLPSGRFSSAPTPVAARPDSDDGTTLTRR